MKQNFTKHDLRTGMLVRFRNEHTGRVYIDVAHDHDSTVDFIVLDSKPYEWHELFRFNEALTHLRESEWDIMEVYTLRHPFSLSATKDHLTRSYQKGSLLWKREEIPGYTLEQVKKFAKCYLGKDYVIIDEKSEKDPC